MFSRGELATGVAIVGGQPLMAGYVPIRDGGEHIIGAAALGSFLVKFVGSISAILWQCAAAAGVVMAVAATALFLLSGGFAVVASEVKSLANQTARATGEIGGQIAQIQTSTQGAVAAIRGIAGIIEQISTVATAIAAAVEQQGAATGEIARSVQQSAQATGAVSETIAGVSAAAGDTGQAAGRIHEAAAELSRESELLSGKGTRFVAGIRGS